MREPPLLSIVSTVGSTYGFGFICMADQVGDATLEALGYKPEFKRVLSLRDLILYGLVILTPTARYPVYGIVQKISHGHAALAYLVAMVAMLFTAASYGKMAGAFPAAGSTYTYAQRSLNDHVGFLAGWAMILDYFLIPLLSVVYAGLTANKKDGMVLDSQNCKKSPKIPTIPITYRK